MCLVERVYQLMNLVDILLFESFQKNEGVELTLTFQLESIAEWMPENHMVDVKRSMISSRHLIAV